MKWCGKIGFLVTENSNGIWSEHVIEKPFTGEIIKNSIQVESSNSVNDNLNLNNQISVIANKFVYDNFQYMKYDEVFGAMWKIKSAELQYPRLLLSIGGIWNGEQEQD